MSEHDDPVSVASEAPSKPQADLGGWLTSWLTGVPQPVLKIGGLVVAAMAVQWLANGGSFQSSPKRGRRR
jgi:hypothetical protein